MDAKKTGALIASQRKALGLTQKELAGRLLVSDKAVSKWETGAGYPEVTLLPCAALQSLLWYAVGTSDWFLLLRFPSVLHQEQVGTITILVTACFFMLVFSLLIWVICTLLSGIHRKPEPSTTSTS